MIAKYGTPEWKPIKETRRMEVITNYFVRCIGCGYQDRHFVDRDEALAFAARHNHLNHSGNYAECCIHSTQTVCECGNILV
jgi:hypothetical protein